MKTKKLFLLSLATSSLLMFSGCSNCKFCDWASSYYKKACSFFKCSTDHKPSGKKIVTNGPIIALESYADFETKVLHSAKPVVVKLHAAWCGACQEMEPVFHALASQMDDITFATVDIDHVSEIGQKYNIIGVPTFLLFKDGEEMRSDNRVIGVVEQEAFKEILEETLLK